MSTSNSINYALKVIEKINNVKTMLRGSAVNAAKVLSEIDSAIVNSEKKDILADGLSGLSMNADDLKTEKDKLQAVAQDMLKKVPELTS